MKPVLQAPGSKRFKLNYDKTAFTCCFQLNLRRYFTAQDGTTTAIYYLEVTRSSVSSNAKLSNVLLLGEGERVTCMGECLVNWPLVTAGAYTRPLSGST